MADGPLIGKITRGRLAAVKQQLDDCKDLERDGEPTRKWLRKYEVAIPIRAEALKWERVRSLRVAPTESIIYDYDEKTEEGTGAKWREN